MSRENNRKDVRYSEQNRLTVASGAVSEKMCEDGSIVREYFSLFFSLPFSFNVIALFVSSRTYREKKEDKSINRKESTKQKRKETK